MFRAVRRFVLIGVLLAGCEHATTSSSPTSNATATVPNPTLRSPQSFDAIADLHARSRALFLEASRVITSPRCLNCHPAGDTPLQGDAMLSHDPPVVRGPDDRGVVAMECTGCHQDHNLELARVPGAPKWHLAPKVMAWVGKGPHALCEQLKDPARNGGRTLEQIIDHSAHDELVGWGWHPGSGRKSAPGTQAEFGALIAAWVQSGAECPEEGASP